MRDNARAAMPPTGTALEQVPCRHSSECLVIARALALLEDVGDEFEIGRGNYSRVVVADDVGIYLLMVRI